MQATSLLALGEPPLSNLTTAFNAAFIHHTDAKYRSLTLMGSNAGHSIADSGWQARVIETILHNTFQIFDED